MLVGVRFPLKTDSAVSPVCITQAYQMPKPFNEVSNKERQIEPTTLLPAVNTLMVQQDRVVSHLGPYQHQSANSHGIDMPWQPISLQHHHNLYLFSGTTPAGAKLQNSADKKLFMHKIICKYGYMR